MYTTGGALALSENASKWGSTIMLAALYSPRCDGGWVDQGVM